MSAWAIVFVAALVMAVYVGYRMGRASAFRQVAHDFGRITGDARREVIRRMVAYDRRWKIRDRPGDDNRRPER